MKQYPNDKNAMTYRLQRMQHWDSVACQMDTWKGMGGYYHKRLNEIYQLLIPQGQCVLEIGCAQGDLLAAVKPSFGVGIDFSFEMLRRARKKHPDYHFVQADAHSFAFRQKFDVIILSDLLNDIFDVQLVLELVKEISEPHTRIIINNYSRLWEVPLSLVKNLGLAKPVLYQNWLTVENTENLLNLAEAEVIQSWSEISLPIGLPLFSSLFNRFLVKMFPFKYFAITNFTVARPVPEKALSKGNEPEVSVIVPARNEAGNIENILERVPQMGRGTEIVFIEGHSSDQTYETILNAVENHPEQKCQVYQQSGAGKGDAVRLGFSKARGDVLMILDADLTVPPEYLPRFYHALVSGQGEFVNGVRLVYPMEKEAMRFFNLLGNKFFSMAFSWLLGQPVNDTLCGTKVLWKSGYQRIADNRSYFGDFDPFGDFDLLFGAAKMRLKIIDMPIRYRERTYGSTNIDRWKHGVLLLRMVLFAAGRIKFI